jgi:NodT family efflux transporter outer membrane factor (OMF) lipoprotein
MDRRLHWVALAGAVALTGCSTLAPPPTETTAGVTPPAAWNAPATAARDAASLADWWRRFDDPALAALIADALAANTEVAAAQAALRQARALADVQAAQVLPSLDASASAQRARAESGATGNTWRAGLDAAWEPDVFGRLRSAGAASALDAQASAATLGDVQVSVAAEVALAYITLRGSEVRLAYAATNLESQQETQQITQWRLQAGLASSLDAEQGRAAVERTRAALPALRKAIALSRHQLALLTGRSVEALELADSAALPQPPADLALAFPADTLRQRADVRAAEARVSAAAQRVVQADAARYPRFSLGGSLGLAALTLSGLGSSSVAASLLGGVSVPLFDGGAAQAQLRAQQAAYEQAAAAHRATVLTALKDVEDALVALARDRERLAALREAAGAAGNAALLARHRHASGLVDFQTVLDTQRTLLTAQDDVASASADVAADHVRLYKALGGGWQPIAPETPLADRS